MMALQDELKAVYGMVIHFFRQLIDGASHYFSYTRELLIAIGICALLGISYVGYRWFSISRDQTAQKAFSEYVHDYQLALKENNPQEWERVETLFNFGRTHYQSSSLFPYFLIMQSDIQLRQGKKAQAVETINQALAHITDSKMASMLKLKKALMQLDEADQAVSQLGLQELVSLARDENNMYKDMALFYLGRYYWAHDKLDDAKKIWQELIDNQWIDKSNQSPWVTEVKATLQQLSA